MRRWICTAYLVVGLVLAACVSEPGTGLLGYFFDGINRPDPHAPKKDPYRLEARVVKRKSVGPTAFLHEPYGDGSCRKCHSAEVSYLTARETRSLCLSCHDEFLKDVSFVHGPAAGGSCLECHHHHWSRIPGILRRPARQLCLECHGEKDLDRGQCRWKEPDQTCIDCHNPHGGSHPFFLKLEEGGK